jgi:pyruvate,water dikinase
VRDRENLRFERTRVFGYARQLFLAIGARLHEADLLDEPRDLFLLTVEEVLALIDGTSLTQDLRGLVALRKGERARFMRLPAPPNRFTGDGLALMQGDFIPTATPTVPIANGDAERKGVGCCAGTVRATVRVIKDPHRAALQPGEILVAQFTDPGWITHFANAAGILVERGSLLSHSAIVARELGIPAIVAIDGVMEWLHTGDTVEMDGATGHVRRVE